MKNHLHKVSQSISDDIRKSVFIITTVGYVDGCGPYEVIRQLHSKNNFKLKGYTSLKIANNISTPMSKSKPIPPDEMKRRIEKAKSKIARMVESLESGKKRIDSGVYPIVVFRKKMNKIVTDAYKQLTIHHPTCKKCMCCSEQCPSKSIVLSNDELVILPTCTACMRCYNICPTYSIWHGGKYADPDEFSRYKGPLVDLQEST
ncbi:MAG TPA: EFR1 family ferrodoxin [Mobilitalea sp.]|nr:EFR1 family ferrodoxin [Mobilitalea sp.]